MRGINMFKEVVKQTEDGRFTVYKCTTEDNRILWVPDDMGNSDRQEIDQFVADGGTITEENI